MSPAELQPANSLFTLRALHSAPLPASHSTCCARYTAHHTLPMVAAGTPSVDNLDEDDWHDLLDVENLLEAYFTIADSTHSTLVGIGGSAACVCCCVAVKLWCCGAEGWGGGTQHAVCCCAVRLRPGGGHRKGATDGLTYMPARCECIESRRRSQGLAL